MRRIAAVVPRGTPVEQGQRIRQARRAAGLTQAALARQIGVPLGVLERLEAGTANPAGYVTAVAEAVGESAEWLRVGDGDRTRM